MRRVTTKNVGTNCTPFACNGFYKFCGRVRFQSYGCKEGLSEAGNLPDNRKRVGIRVIALLFVLLLLLLLLLMMFLLVLLLVLLLLLLLSLLLLLQVLVLLVTVSFVGALVATFVRLIVVVVVAGGVACVAVTVDVGLYCRC